MKEKLTFVIIIILSCLNANAQSESETLVSLAKVNYEGITEFTQWSSYEGSIATIEVVDDGIAINNPKMQEQSWQPQLIVVPDGSFDLKEGHDYIVRLTIRVPSDGKYMVNIGSWSTNFTCHAPATAKDDFQIIDVEYPEYESSVTGGHVLFGCGWVPGTTIIKEVEVLEKRGASGIRSVKASKVAGDMIYNLSGQKVSPSYKGVVIKDGKKSLR